MSPADKPYSLTKIGQYVGGDHGQLMEMIALFLSTTPNELQDLTRAVENANWPEAYKLSHRIKPSIDVLEVKNVIPLIRQVELLSKNEEDCHLLPGIMDGINDTMTRVFLLLGKEK